MSQPRNPGPPDPGEQLPAGWPFQGWQHDPGQEPYHDEPYAGRPNPDVPPARPPAYPPPAPHGQPDYGQPPAYRQPSHPAGVPETKSRALPILLTVVGLALVLCTGGAVTFYLVAKKNANQESARFASPGTAAPAVPPPSGTRRLVEPATLNGRPKLDNPQYAAFAEELERQFKAAPGATSSIGALYGTVAERNVVIVAGSVVPVADPAQEVGRNLASAGFGGVEISDLTDAATGDFGGVAKCGNAQTAAGLNSAVCTWADEGSSGVIVWFYTVVDTAATEFPQLRTQIETKG